MLKANEKTSQENRAKIVNAINGAANGENFDVVYGYEEKNLMVINLISHFALGFNENKIMVTPIKKDGTVSGESHTFNDLSQCKFNSFGKLVLDNGSKKIKMVVPGVVPSLPGTRQLPINQLDEYTKLFNVIKK